MSMVFEYLNCIHHILKGFAFPLIVSHTRTYAKTMFNASQNLCKWMRERDNSCVLHYLSAIVVIADNEDAPAAVYVMWYPLDFHNIGIAVNCMIISFLNVWIRRWKIRTLNIWESFWPSNQVLHFFSSQFIAGPIILIVDCYGHFKSKKLSRSYHLKCMIFPA